jgi:hypothetical protein
VFKSLHIENVAILAGKTVTVSFWAKADSNKNIVVATRQSFGSGGSPSANISGNSNTIALTTTWQKKTITVTMPSIVGKTLGTDGVHTTDTSISIWFDAGSSFDTRAANLGQQSGTFDIAEVKIEDGSVATDCWHPYDGEFGGEIQACQRYYEKSGSNLAGYISSHTPLTGPANIPGFRFNAQKRVAPTVTILHGVNGTAGQVYRITDAVAVTVTSIDHMGVSGVGSFTLSAGSANGYIFNFIASAEL